MRLMRLKMTTGLSLSFKSTNETKNNTRKMIEDKKFVEECMNHNLSFLKSIPNSVHYWLGRKKDLFAMMRQLGKPTIFLTLSASETRWPRLLKTLFRLKYGRDYDNKDTPINELLFCYWIFFLQNLVPSRNKYFIVIVHVSSS